MIRERTTISLLQPDCRFRRRPKMIIRHHDNQLELADSWLIAAGAASFVPSSSAYIVDETSRNGHVISLIDIRDIAPVRRGCGVPFFHARGEEGLTALGRVV